MEHEKDLKNAKEEQSSCIALPLDSAMATVRFSSSEIAMLDILHRYSALRYSELMHYLEASDYWRSSSTFQREIDHLLESGSVEKKCVCNKVCYCITASGLEVLNSNTLPKICSVSSFNLSPFYLSTYFLETKIETCGGVVDSSFALIKEIAKVYNSWEQLFEAWLLSPELSSELLPDCIENRFISFMQSSLIEALVSVEGKKKCACLVPESYKFIRKESKKVAELYNDGVGAICGHYLLCTLSQSVREHFVIELFNDWLLGSIGGKSEQIASLYRQYGIPNLNSTRCIINYCKSVFFSVVYRKSSKILAKHELAVRLNLSSDTVEVLAEKIVL